MIIDGEWRAGMIDDSNSKVNYGVAPFPVPDDMADQYGKGYITGTIVGIASTSAQAERRVGVREVPDHRHRRRRELRQRDPQRAVDHRGPGVAGREPGPELPDVHQDRVRTRTATRRRPAPTVAPTSSPCRTWATPTSRASRPTSRPVSTTPPSRSTPTSPRASEPTTPPVSRPDAGGGRRTRDSAGCAARVAAQPGLPVAVAARDRPVLPLPARDDGVPVVHPVRRLHLADVGRAGQLAVRASTTTRSSGRRCATRCGSSWCW